MFLRALVATCFLCAIGSVQQVKVEDDNRVNSNRVVLKCNDTRMFAEEKKNFCAMKSTRCLLLGYTIGKRDEIYHPKEAHYISCLLFDKSMVTILTQEFFASYPVVRYVDLSYSNLGKVADFTFGLPSLMDINLRGNNLTSLTASVFHGADKLQNIDLSHNQIKHLQPETFMNLGSLVELNLSFNELHNNSFNRNGVDWVDTIQSLKVLDLSHNNLFYYEVMPYQCFSGLVNLESLNLESNQVTIDFGAFATNHHLKSLDFSYNKMTYFDLNFLLSVVSLENLYLHGNALAYASQIDLSDIRAVFPNIKSLGISENSFSCEVLSVIIKKILKASIQLVVEDEKFVSNRRNLRGVSCV